MTQTGEEAPLLQRLLIGRNPVWTLIRATVIAVSMLVFFTFVVRPVRIEGSSMEPSYRNQSIHWIYRLAFRRATPQRGDVVSIQTTGIHNMYFKRVVGLPGETLSIRSGTVLINGEALAEPYVVYRNPWEFPARELARDEFLVIGDNRGMPQEWHSWGVVKRNQIVGKAVR